MIATIVYIMSAFAMCQHPPAPCVPRTWPPPLSAHNSFHPAPRSHASTHQACCASAHLGHVLSASGLRRRQLGLNPPLLVTQVHNVLLPPLQLVAGVLRSRAAEEDSVWLGVDLWEGTPLRPAAPHVPIN